MGSKDGYDLKSLAYELNTKCFNGFCINFVTEEQTTNSTTYARAGGGILDLDIFRYAKTLYFQFEVASGSVGNDGMDVRLWDRANSAEAGIVSFTGAEDDSIKVTDVRDYFSSITGRTLLEVFFRKAGAVGPSNISGATLYIYGSLKGVS